MCIPTLPQPPITPCPTRDVADVQLKHIQCPEARTDSFPPLQTQQSHEPINTFDYYRRRGTLCVQRRQSARRAPSKPAIPPCAAELSPCVQHLTYAAARIDVPSPRNHLCLHQLPFQALFVWPRVDSDKAKKDLVPFLHLPVSQSAAYPLHNTSGKDHLPGRHSSGTRSPLSCSCKSLTRRRTV